MTTTELNALPEQAAARALLECCASRGWAAAMTMERPFSDAEMLHAAADAIWGALDREDLLEAFAAHPRIGERAAPDASERHARWSEAEQSGAQGADPEVAAALARGNREYEMRFGHVFLIRATGRSADEMLTALRTRLLNEPEREFAVASEEQRRIMHLRLEKLLEP